MFSKEAWVIVAGETPVRLVLLVLAVSFSLPADGCEDLRGRWESESRTKAGLGQVFEFAGAGVVFVTLAGIADSRYVLEGDRLSSTFADPADPSKPIRINYALRFKGATLTMKELLSGNDQIMTRVGRSVEAKPLLGVWSWKHASGLEASTRFTQAGIMMTRLPIKTEKGSYQCLRESVSIEVPGKKAETRSYRFERGDLVLGTTETAGEKRFRPAE